MNLFYRGKFPEAQFYSIKDTINPYGDGKTSQRIKNKLKTVDINSHDPAHNLIRKEFYDIINN